MQVRCNGLFLFFFVICLGFYVILPFLHTWYSKTCSFKSFFENIKVFLFWLISQLFSNSSTKTENSVYLRHMILREEDERLMETELV